MSVMGMDCIGSIISMLCFHSESKVAEDGVLVELIMMEIVRGGGTPGEMREGGNLLRAVAE